LSEQAEALGLPAEAVAELIGSQAPKEFEVWPENWPAVDLFIRCQTQWHWRPDGRRGGLIYSELIAMGKLFSVANLEQVVADVQVIEIEILNQEASR
jgi:hypothetical protein